MIRLSPDGPSRNEGRVEMCYQNVWGAVYDQSWSQFDAAVACAQLNFSRTGQKKKNFFFHAITIINTIFSHRSIANHWRSLWSS
jgi:hypothetical protein